jgi:hypothetical protein
MSANYPTSVKVWSPTDAAFRYPEDLTTIVYARHVTTIYNEVTAIQTELGAGSGGLRTSVVEAANTFSGSTSGFAWGSLRARLANLEQGVLDGVNRRVKTDGGSTILPSSASTVGVAIRAASSQTANLLEFRNSSNSVTSRFGSDGLLAGVIDGGNA